MEASLEETYSARETEDSGTFGRRIMLQSLGAVGVGLAAGTVVTAANGDGNPTEIDSCTVIDEPGEYVLVDDVSPDQEDRVACIEIAASDVTLRGGGHTVDGHGTDDVGFGIAVNPRSPQGGPILENVLVEDVTVTGLGVGVEYRNTRDGRITGVSTPENAVGLRMAEDVMGLELDHSRAMDCNTGLFIGGDHDIGTMISNGEIHHNDFFGNNLGIHLGHASSNNRFERNRIVSNGNGVFQTTFAEENEFYHNHICLNEGYGYQNSDALWVDIIGEGDPDEGVEFGVLAMKNYWGASNGPSSFGDPEESFTDPETGRPADGDGDAISEGLDEGVANVRFDPFLESTLDEVGANFD